MPKPLAPFQPKLCHPRGNSTSVLVNNSSGLKSSTSSLCTRNACCQSSLARYFPSLFPVVFPWLWHWELIFRTQWFILHTLQNTCKKGKISCSLRAQSPGSVFAIFSRMFKCASLAWILTAIISHWQLSLRRRQWTVNPWVLLLQWWQSMGQNSHICALPHSDNHSYNFPTSETRLPLTPYITLL